MKRSAPAGSGARPSWKIRRRVVALTLLFCAGAVTWLLAGGEDTELNKTIANGLILLAGGVIGSYVFGAAWDDANVMRNFGQVAYAEESAAAPVTEAPDACRD